MAAGYMQTGAMTALLEVGADPLLRDKAGRDVVSLVERLRGSMPPSMGALQRIMALEQVAAALQDRGEQASKLVGESKHGQTGIILHSHLPMQTPRLAAQSLKAAGIGPTRYMLLPDYPILVVSLACACLRPHNACACQPFW